MRKVAIVDDVLPNALLLKGYLKHLEDVEAETFTDPAVALDWCVENVPDLVLLDFLMPEMDGAAFLGRFNEHEHLRDIPVVIITGAEDKETLHRALEAGALDVLHKPVNDIELSARVRNMLLLRTHQLEIQAQSERLRQSEKMEALGQLAGGIAHEFNNLLQTIQGFTSMALKKVEDTDRVRLCLEEVTEASVRAADLTRQILSFSRKQVLDPKVMRPEEAIRSTEKLLRASLEESVHLQFEAGGNDLCIEVDPARLSEAILNLAINAGHAMPNGGRLTISSAAATLDAGLTTRHGERLPPGRYVRVDVTDEGKGMAPSTLEHIFEPFFTTKDMTKGTGLGLSMVYGMVKNSDGAVDVESTEGVGTTFSIYLPTVDKLPTGEERRSRGEPAEFRGTETILLAEDDAQVRAFVKTSLEDQGYTVLAAPDGQAAIEVCKENAERINLLVTDVIMPEMNGVELAEALTDQKPGLKVIFMTGYSAEVTETLKQISADNAILKKPFDDGALGRLIRKALDPAA